MLVDNGGLISEVYDMQVNLSFAIAPLSFAEDAIIPTLYVIKGEASSVELPEIISEEG